MVRIPVAKPELGEPESQAIQQVIDSGWVTQGPRVAEFEEEIRTLCGATYAVAVSSCTAALHLALICHDVGAGDEVILPSLSFIATANAVVHCGATPVFADVEEGTQNLNVHDVTDRLTSRTKAILLVHQFGLPADIDAFAKLANDHNISLIEDAACAIGSRHHGKPVGGDGNTTCFSFHPRKLITTGDGGMLLTDSEVVATRARSLRQHAMDIPDTVRHDAPRVTIETYSEVGYNYRLTDLQAAIGLAQLQRLPHIIAGRRSLVERYDALLAPHPSIQTPTIPSRIDWNAQSYSVRLDGFTRYARDAVMQGLLDEGIATRPGVMTAHRQPAYSSLPPAALPISEEISDSSIILPLHLKMSTHDVHEVADRLSAIVDGVSS